MKNMHDLIEAHSHIGGERSFHHVDKRDEVVSLTFSPRGACATGITAFGTHSSARVEKGLGQIIERNILFTDRVGIRHY